MAKKKSKGAKVPSRTIASFHVDLTDWQEGEKGRKVRLAVETEDFLYQFLMSMLGDWAATRLSMPKPRIDVEFSDDPPKPKKSRKKP